MDHLLNAADQGTHDLRRHPLIAGRLVKHLPDEHLEGVDRPVDQGDALGAGRIDVDEAHLRGSGLGDDLLEQRFECLLCLLYVPGSLQPGLDRLQSRADQRFDRGDEARLLVAEVSVKGAAGDARELDQVSHRRRLIATLGDRRHQRGKEPLALIALGLLPRRSPPGPQLPPLELCSVSPGRFHHRERKISSADGRGRVQLG